MTDLDPTKKAIILGTPTIVVVAFVAMWMSSTEDVEWSVSVLAMAAPLGLGVGWMILNLFNVADNV